MSSSSSCLPCPAHAFREWTYRVDASVWADPLVLPGYGLRPPLLFIATMANSIYAFDIRT